MDPADLDQVREAIRLQGQRLGGHEQVLHSLLDKMNQLSAQLAQSSLTQTAVPVQSVESPRRFSNDSAKIAYVASLLEGPPLSYFNALLEKESPVARSYSRLCAELKRVYDHPWEVFSLSQ
uniref:Uncharacterized protein n=1 Tax=Sphaeramia orbicularis TaxID=375764 RepID=A0A673BHR9_9TELE